MPAAMRPPKARLYHRGALVRANGDVSALCFARPRRIDLSRAMWTNRDEATTCPKCLALIAARNAERAQHDPAGGAPGTP